MSYTPSITAAKAALAVSAIHYVNSVPGAGKTHAALEIATHVLNGGNHNFVLVYAAPTMKLIEQFHEELSKRAPKKMKRVHVLDSKRWNESVARRFHGLLNSYADANMIIKKIPDGSIILTTHECLRRVPLDMPGKDRVSLIFDEARQCMQESLSLKAPNQVVDHVRTTCVEVHEALNNMTTARWQWIDGKRLDRHRVHDLWKQTQAKPPEKEITRFMAFVKELQNGSQHVWVDLHEDKNNVQEFQVNVTLSPSRLFANYGKVLIMSAFFEYSQMYHMLKRQECDMQTEKGRMRARVLEQADRVYMINVTDQLIDRKRVANIMKKRLTNATITYVLKDESLSKYHITRGIIVKHTSRQNLSYVSKKYADLYAAEPNARGSAPSFSSFLKICKAAEAGYASIPDSALDRHALLMALKPSKYSVIQYLSGRSVALQHAWLKRNKLKHEPLLLCINARAQSYDYTNSRLWDNENLDELLNGSSEKKRVLEVPVISQGMNTWQHLNTAAFMATVKLSRDQITFLRNLLPNYIPDLDRTVDQCIQFIFRSAIRDANSDTKCLLIVSDLKLATQVNDTLGAHMDIVCPSDLLGDKWQFKTIAVYEAPVNVEVKKQLNQAYQQTETYKKYRANYDKKRTATETGKLYRSLTQQIHRRETRLKKDPDNQVLIEEVKQLRAKRSALKEAT